MSYINPELKYKIYIFDAFKRTHLSAARKGFLVGYNGYRWISPYRVSSQDFCLNPKEVVIGRWNSDPFFLGWIRISQQSSNLSSLVDISSKRFLPYAARCISWPSFHGNRKACLWSKSNQHTNPQRPKSHFPLSHWWDPAASSAPLANFSHNEST